MFAQVEFALNVDLISDRIQTDGSAKSISSEPELPFNEVFGDVDQPEPTLRQTPTIDLQTDTIVRRSPILQEQIVQGLPIDRTAGAGVPFENTRQVRIETMPVNTDDPIVAHTNTPADPPGERTNELRQNLKEMQATVPVKASEATGPVRPQDIEPQKGDPPVKQVVPPEQAPNPFARPARADNIEHHLPFRTQKAAELGSAGANLLPEQRPNVASFEQIPRNEQAKGDIKTLRPEFLSGAKIPLSDASVRFQTEISAQKPIQSEAAKTVESLPVEPQQDAPRKQAIRQLDEIRAPSNELPTKDPRPATILERPNFGSADLKQPPVFEEKVNLQSPTNQRDPISRPQFEVQTVNTKATQPGRLPPETVANPIIIGIDNSAQKTFVDGVLGQDIGIVRSDAGDAVLRFHPAEVGVPRAVSPPQFMAHEQIVLRQIAANAPLTPSERVVEIALDPVELGRVRMTLSQTDSGVTLVIMAERPETLDLMRRNASALSDELSDLGFDSVELSFSSNENSTEQNTDDRTNSRTKDDLLEFEGMEFTQQTRIRLTNADEQLDVRL